MLKSGPVEIPGPLQASHHGSLRIQPRKRGAGLRVLAPVVGERCERQELYLFSQFYLTLYLHTVKIKVAHLGLDFISTLR